MKQTGYICDCCGGAIEKPHAVHMREFWFGMLRRVYGWARSETIYTQTIHLCDECFTGLKYIASHKAEATGLVCSDVSHPKAPSMDMISGVKHLV